MRCNTFFKLHVWEEFPCNAEKIKNLRVTITEPLEYTFASARLLESEFIVGEFISYSNRLKIMMKNALESGIFRVTQVAKGA